MVVGLTDKTDIFADKINAIKIKQLTDVDNDPEAHADVISQVINEQLFDTVTYEG